MFIPGGCMLVPGARPLPHAHLPSLAATRRAHKRAKETAARIGDAGDPDGVAAGTYVQLQVG